MAENFTFFLRQGIHFPPTHDPKDKPSMKTEITTDKNWDNYSKRSESYSQPDNLVEKPAKPRNKKK